MSEKEKHLAFLKEWYTGPQSIIGSFKKKGWKKKSERVANA